MIAHAALTPPAIVQPAAFQASFGLVTGSVGPGTVRIRVRVGSRLAVDRPLRGRRFSLHVDLPPRDVAVRVTAVGRDGGRRDQRRRARLRTAAGGRAATRLDPS